MASLAYSYFLLRIYKLFEDCILFVTRHLRLEGSKALIPITLRLEFPYNLNVQALLEHQVCESNFRSINKVSIRIEKYGLSYYVGNFASN